VAGTRPEAIKVIVAVLLLAVGVLLTRIGRMRHRRHHA
jgi:hypothetical protein